MNFLNITLFHAKVYSKNNYFVTLLLTSVISMALIEYTLSYMSGNAMISETLWVTPAIFGFWNLCVTSAGALSFQRNQQTLMYLINTSIPDALSILALLMAPATFGLLSFPLSYMFFSVALHTTQSFTIQILVSILLLYAGGMVVSFLISALFLVTKNAIVYEKLLVIPFLLFSGLFNPNLLPPVLSKIMLVINPIAAPINYLYFGDPIYIVYALIAIMLGAYMVKRTLHRSIEYAKQSALTERN